MKIVIFSSASLFYSKARASLLRIDSTTTGNLPTRQRFMYPLCSETLRLGPRHSAQVINIQTLNVELISEGALRFKGISSREFTRTLQIPEGSERHSPFVIGFHPRPFRLGLSTYNAIRT